MAVQAQFFSENMGLPMCGLHDPNSLGVVDHHDRRFSIHQYPQQITHFHLPHTTTQKLAVHCNNEGISTLSSSCNSFPPMAFFQSLDAQFELQRQEINYILQFQVIIFNINMLSQMGFLQIINFYRACEFVFWFKMVRLMVFFFLSFFLDRMKG
jgi:hypothetical protein